MTWGEGGVRRVAAHGGGRFETYPYGAKQVMLVEGEGWFPNRPYVEGTERNADGHPQGLPQLRRAWIPAPVFTGAGSARGKRREGWVPACARTREGEISPPS